MNIPKNKVLFRNYSDINSHKLRAIKFQRNKKQATLGVPNLTNSSRYLKVCRIFSIVNSSERTTYKVISKLNGIIRGSFNFHKTVSSLDISLWHHENYPIAHFSHFKNIKNLKLRLPPITGRGNLTISIQRRLLTNLLVSRHLESFDTDIVDQISCMRVVRRFALKSLNLASPIQHVLKFQKQISKIILENPQVKFKSDLVVNQGDNTNLDLNVLRNLKSLIIRNSSPSVEFPFNYSQINEMQQLAHLEYIDRSSLEIEPQTFTGFNQLKRLKHLDFCIIPPFASDIHTIFNFLDFPESLIGLRLNILRLDEKGVKDMLNSHEDARFFQQLRKLKKLKYMSIFLEFFSQHGIYTECSITTKQLFTKILDGIDSPIEELVLISNNSQGPVEISIEEKDDMLFHIGRFEKLKHLILRFEKIPLINVRKSDFKFELQTFSLTSSGFKLVQLLNTSKLHGISLHVTQSILQADLIEFIRLVKSHTLKNLTVLVSKSIIGWDSKQILFEIIDLMNNYKGIQNISCQFTKVKVEESDKSIILKGLPWTSKLRNVSFFFDNITITKSGGSYKVFNQTE